MANVDENVTFDAQQLNEDIEAGEKDKPKVNVDSDYEKSKEFATSNVDPAKATKPSIVEPQATLKSDSSIGSFGNSNSDLTSNPESFRELAKEANQTLRDEE